MTRQIVAAHQGVVGHHVAEQVVELAEDEAAPVLALLLVPGVGRLVPGDVRDGGDVEAGQPLLVLDDADEAIGALADAQQPLEHGVAGGCQVAVEQKALMGGHDDVEQLALLLDPLLGQHLGGDVVGQLDHPEQGPRFVGDGHVGGVDPEGTAIVHDAAKLPRVDLALQHALPEASVLGVQFRRQQQQMGLADQRIGGIAEHAAEQQVDRHHAAIQIELDHAVGPVEGGQPGQGLITIERVDIARADCWGIHGYDSFRSPSHRGGMREQELRS
ncbi:hypothetical protein D3C86_1430230 [compost metagenome]